jgi:L-threonylcarbamoyladenylate synthase
LGCLPLRRHAVERLLAIKRRSWRKGLAVIAADLTQLEPLVVLPSGRMGAQILASWPGPATWLLPARPTVPYWLNGGRDTLAVRVTDHPLANELCRRVASPLVSTSANRSGRPPLRSALLVRREFAAELDCVLAGALGGSSGPTAIRDGRTGELLRAS